MVSRMSQWSEQLKSIEEKNDMFLHFKCMNHFCFDCLPCPACAGICVTLLRAQVRPAAPHTLGLVHTDESSASTFSAPHLASSPMKPPCPGKLWPNQSVSAATEDGSARVYNAKIWQWHDKTTTEEAIVQPTLALCFTDLTVMNAWKELD